MQTPYGGRTVAQAYNPWTGTYAATSQGHNAYSQWGSSVVTQGNDWARTAHVTTANGGTAGYRTSDGGAGRVVYGPQGAAGVAKTANDDIYAGKDGNVYKRDPGHFDAAFFACSRNRRIGLKMLVGPEGFEPPTKGL